MTLSSRWASGVVRLRMPKSQNMLQRQETTGRPCLALAGFRLRPARAHDLSAVKQLLHNEKVRRYLCDDTRLPDETVAAILQRSETLAARGLGTWIIEEQSGAMLGIICLEPVSEIVSASALTKNGIEPTIALHPDVWGLGIASEALRAIITYAAEILGLSDLVAAVDEPNSASHHLLKACGFAEIGQTTGPTHTLRLYRLSLKSRRAG